MFNKKCKRCGNKIIKEYNFCPVCGQDIVRAKREADAKNYGILGKNDLDSGGDVFGGRLPLGLNSLFNNLMKQMNQNFKELDKNISKDLIKNKKSKMPNSGISISISTSGDGEPKINVKRYGKGGNEINENGGVKEKPLAVRKISDEKAKKISKLPREEAKTNVRRLSKKIVYEINLPGVKNISDVIIQKLENNVEIKAFSEKKAYFKLLPINLPIVNYKLQKEKLVLEFLE